MVDDVMGFGFGRASRPGHPPTISQTFSFTCANWDTSLLGSGLHYGAWGSMNPAVMNLRMLAVLQEQQRLEHRQCLAMAQQQGLSLNLALAGVGNAYPPGLHSNPPLASVRVSEGYPKDVVLYDYPVVIAPDVVSAAVPHEIAHDCTQRLVSRSRLPADFFATVSEGSERVYTVKVLEPKELRAADLDRYLQGEDVNYNPLPIISAFNLVTTAHASQTGMPDKKGCLFPLAVLGESPLALSAGLEAWKGFFASVRPVYKMLMVNINVCTGAFYVPNACLSNAMIKHKQTSYGASNPQSFFTGTKSKIKAFGNQSARKTVFQCDELGGMISTSASNMRTTFSVINVGNKMKDIFVPAELCEIEPGQPFADMLSGSEAAEMTKYSANPPYINAKAITEQGIRLLGPLTVANGSWNTRDVHLHRNAPLTGAAVLVLADNGREDFRDSSDPALCGVVTRFLATCLAGGMQVDDAFPPLLFVRLPPMNPRDPLRTAAIVVIEK
ncbi:hypothetical protein DFH11DRAFT_1746682 [Phellopilus nigrolimitatus]|nr:hypothetical protein DFH11DRAFT_1746682 [Phellopilus nigrolimitatus]